MSFFNLPLTTYNLGNCVIFCVSRVIVSHKSRTLRIFEIQTWPEFKKK